MRPSGGGEAFSATVDDDVRVGSAATSWTSAGSEMLSLTSWLPAARDRRRRPRPTSVRRGRGPVERRPTVPPTVTRTVVGRQRVAPVGRGRRTARSRPRIRPRRGDGRRTIVTVDRVARAESTPAGRSRPTVRTSVGGRAADRERRGVDLESGREVVGVAFDGDGRRVDSDRRRSRSRRPACRSRRGWTGRVRLEFAADRDRDVDAGRLDVDRPNLAPGVDGDAGRRAGRRRSRMAWTTTRASTAATCRTTESGPRNRRPPALAGSDRRSSSPAGTSPCSTVTGTDFVTSGSSRTTIDGGSKSRTWTRGSGAVTMTLAITTGRRPGAVRRKGRPWH